MKMVSTFALGIALALGGVTMAAQPAFAKDKAPKEAKEKPLSLSKGVRDAGAPAQDALAKKDLVTAAAKLAEARAVATSPDDKYFVGSLTYDLGRAQNDTKAQADGIGLMIESGRVTGAQLGQFNLVLGNLAYQANDFKRADVALTNAIQAGGAQIDAYALLAETKEKLGDSAGAIAVIQQAAAAQQAAGQKLPAAYYGRGIGIGYKAKLGPQVEQLTQAWLKDYPTPDNWRDSLITYRDLNKFDVDYELDIMRLMRTAKAMKGEADYYGYAEQVYLKFPGEGRAVIDEGVAAGYLKLDPNSNIKLFSDTSSKRLAADKADLAGAAAAAQKSSTGVSARATADSYLGYGNYAKAADLYRLALQKGGVDANVVNTRLGMALARSGDKAGAKQAFALVTGPRAGLAKYWNIWIDQQP